MTERRRGRRKTPDQDAMDHIISGEDKSFLEGRFINTYKGRGVFTQEYIEPKSFVVEYRGVLSLSDGIDDKNSKYTFDFMWNGKPYCIDAAKEDGTLGRLVNDDHIHPNCKVKRIMVKGRPHLCLFAVKEIFPGEEITYNYGDSSWPWRSMVPCEEQSDPKLKESEPAIEKEVSRATDDMMAVVSSSPTTSKDDNELSGATDDMMAVVNSSPTTSKDDNVPCEEQSDLKLKESEPPSEKEVSGGTDDMMAVLSSTPATSKHDTEVSGGTDDMMAVLSSTPATSKHDTVPCEELSDPMLKESEPPSEKEVSGGTDDMMAVVSSTPATSKDDTCPHRIISAVVNALDHCEVCNGPVSSLRWLGFTCTLCSRSWHKSCFFKMNSLLNVDDEHVSDSASSDGYSSDDVYEPDTASSCAGSHSDEDGVPDTNRKSSSEDPQSVNLPHCKGGPVKSLSSQERTKSVLQPISCLEQEDKDSYNSGKFGIDDDLIPDSEPCSDDDPTTSKTQTLPRSTKESTESEAAPEVSSCTPRNYCYVCKTPQSKISRHLKKHEKEEPDIAEAFSFPQKSKERKILLDKLRNKGNYEHNQEVLKNHGGQLKIKRRPARSKVSVNTKTHVHCIYCKGMFNRKELWRHLRRCPLKMVSETKAVGKTKVLVLVDMAEATYCQAISAGVWKVLGNMRQDEIASIVRNDFLILQLGQSLYNKHGSDPTKFEYIRTKVREMGRLLLTLRKKYSIFTFEDAVKPNNFYKIIGAVRAVAGYDEEKHSYSTPSLALKLGHSLKKIGDIILCRAIAAEDENLIKAAERFTQLCTKEWAGQVSHTALATLSKSKFNKPSTIPFTEDVQLLHKYLEEKSAGAIENLKDHESPQAYAELARVTLAQIILFNRRRAGEVSKMTLESFKKRDQTELHSDIAASLSPFEQKLAKHFSRVEIMGKRGRKVAVLLNLEVVSATTLLSDKRDTCNVHKDNPFLFGRPQCPPTSHYRGQDCIRIFAHTCGAKNPYNLRSTHLRKHIATLSQILNLKNNELDQLANFLGHDIRVHRDFYRLPEATIEMAKITKLLLAMEKGTLAKFQGKSLDEIEVEDKLDPELDDGDDGDDGDDEDDGDNEDDGDDEGGGDDGDSGNNEGGGDDGNSGDNEGGGDDKDGGNEESDCPLELRGQKKQCVTQSVVSSSKGAVFVFPPEAPLPEKPRSEGATYVNIPVSPTSKKQLNYMELELQEPGPGTRGTVAHLQPQKKSSTKYAQIDITATETAHKVGTQHALGRQEGLHTLELRRKGTPH